MDKYADYAADARNLRENAEDFTIGGRAGVCVNAADIIEDLLKEVETAKAIITDAITYDPNTHSIRERMKEFVGWSDQQ